MPKNDELDIVFSGRDGHNIRQPHDDPLVIILRVEEFNIHRVLIDNESSTDIIYLPALNSLKAATTIYYLKVKFSTAHGVGEIRRGQVLARECYQATLASGENYMW